jgi:hypothetical protein
MAAWRTVESADAGRLVYIDKGLPLVGLLLSLVGLSGTIGTGRQVVVSLLTGPRDSSSIGSYVLGTLLCIVLLALGFKMLLRREVVLDRAASQVIRTRCWLFWRRSVTTKLEGFAAVGWRHKWRDPGSDIATSIYPVYLRGREPKIELFETLQMEEARQLTADVSAFLGLEAEQCSRE